MTNADKSTVFTRNYLGNRELNENARIILLAVFNDLNESERDYRKSGGEDDSVAECQQMVLKAIAEVMDGMIEVHSGWFCYAANLAPQCEETLTEIVARAEEFKRNIAKREAEIAEWKARQNDPSVWDRPVGGFNDLGNLLDE